MVGIIGCGDDDNPVRSNQDLLVGTWEAHADPDEDEYWVTFRSDGTLIDSDGDEATWSLVGDQLTLTWDDEDSGSYTITLNSVTDTELTTTSKDEDGEETETLTRKT